ncbi:hypothetical protein ACJRW5_19915 [Pseudomonas sp. SH1-B]
MLEWLLHGLRLLLERVTELITGYLFYGAGRLVLRLLTLGRYPDLPLRAADPMGPRTAWVAVFEFCCLAVPPLTWLTFTYG